MNVTDLVILTSGTLLNAAVLLVALVTWVGTMRPPMPQPIDIVRQVATRKAGPDCPAFGGDHDCKAAPAIAPAPRSYWR